MPTFAYFSERNNGKANLKQRKIITYFAKDFES